MEIRSITLNFIEGITQRFIGQEVSVVLADGTEYAGTLQKTAKSMDDCVVYKLRQSDGKTKTFAASYPHDYIMYGQPYTVKGNDAWNPLQF